VVSNVDWDCEVKTKFEEKNLGCKIAMSSAISWFFENVEMGIILEDDCLPHPDFFKFTETLLLKYKDDPRIMMISGDNFQDGHWRGDGSYYFSKFDHIWGWATWRRAWSKYDLEMKGFEEWLKTDPFSVRTKNKIAKHTLESQIKEVYKNKIDTWDFQWAFTILKNNGLVILPNQNLVSNIGYGENATHTKKFKVGKADLETKAILPLVHPSHTNQNKEADEYTALKLYGSKPGIIKRFLAKLWQ
jgi:hypothetical protein